jgi:hypothetical protein
MFLANRFDVRQMRRTPGGPGVGGSLASGEGRAVR